MLGCTFSPVVPSQSNRVMGDRGPVEPHGIRTRAGVIFFMSQRPPGHSTAFLRCSDVKNIRSKRNG